MEKDQLIVVIGRAKSGLQKIFGKDYLSFLICYSRVAFLVMLWAHKENHDVRDVTISIACSNAWIVNAKRLTTPICNSCAVCVVAFYTKSKLSSKWPSYHPKKPRLGIGFKRWLL